jgi:chromosomal replication initiation ATPase DnaA
LSLATRVAEQVATETGISVEQQMGKSRQAPIVRARRETMRRLYVERNQSTPALAREFGMAAKNVRHHLMAVGVKLGRR